MLDYVISDGQWFVPTFTCFNLHLLSMFRHYPKFNTLLGNIRKDLQYHESSRILLAILNLCKLKHSLTRISSMRRNTACASPSRKKEIIPLQDSEGMQLFEHGRRSISSKESELVTSSIKIRYTKIYIRCGIIIIHDFESKLLSNEWNTDRIFSTWIIIPMIKIIMMKNNSNKNNYNEK